jgi:phage shock protein A
VRRTAEMEAAAEMLTELGVPPLMAEASRALHERLADENLGRGRSSQLRSSQLRSRPAA